MPERQGRRFCRPGAPTRPGVSVRRVKSERAGQSGSGEAWKREMALAPARGRGAGELLRRVAVRTAAPGTRTGTHQEAAPISSAKLQKPPGGIECTWQRSLFGSEAQWTRREKQRPTECSLRSIRGRLQLLERELSQLQQEHCDTADTGTLGHIRVKVQEYQETALLEIRHMGKYAVARTYGEGDRPGKVLANLIHPSRSANLINKMTATDGSTLNDPEDIAARIMNTTKHFTPQRETLNL
ncbi:hypothetical protein NDU88_004979 [Pleurodeles waltl]|uniref:Uncharacterized protein n=1 Tax=Pleurodeles waltl TaxID=8319 RepID=A0AAV7MWZ2_PLEWA|nr:hypothetical protein NDU88_004979 [Pleurodeles waltl]